MMNDTKNDGPRPMCSWREIITIYASPILLAAIFWVGTHVFGLPWTHMVMVVLLGVALGVSVVWRMQTMRTRQAITDALGAK